MKAHYNSLLNVYLHNLAVMDLVCFQPNIWSIRVLSVPPSFPPNVLCNNS